MAEVWMVEFKLPAQQKLAIVLNPEGSQEGHSRRVFFFFLAYSLWSVGDSRLPLLWDRDLPPAPSEIRPEARKHSRENTQARQGDFAQGVSVWDKDSTLAVGCW